MLTPINKKIIIKPIEINQGALILTGIKPTQFEIIAIGEDVMRASCGDIIYIHKHAGAEIEHEKEKFLVIHEDDILAKVD